MEVAAQPVRIGGPNPFKLFPDLVWKNIIDQLEGPAELWNLLEAFPQLHEVTKPQEILFDKMLPMVFKDLHKNNVLTCREVCKWWKKSLDYFLENHPSQQPYDPSSYSKIIGYRYCTLESKRMKYVRICRSKGVERKRKEAEDLMERHSTVPSFIGRSVIFSLFEDFLKWSELEQLLTERSDIAAGCVWYADFKLSRADVYNDDFCDLKYYEGFRKCLEKLPNLRSLTIGECYSSIQDDDTYDYGLDQFRSDIRTLSLPDLPELETLQLTHFQIIRSNLRFIYWGSDYEPDEWIPREDFFHMLLNKYAPQLRKLRMSTVFWKEEFGSRLQLLTELFLDLELEDENVFTLLRSILEKLNSPNLEKLGIKMPPRKLIRALSLKNVFESIQIRQFKMLTIQVIRVTDHISVRDTLETLPSLVAFTLEILLHDPRMPLPIFTCFPNLEYLEIRNGRNPIELTELSVKAGPLGTEMTVWKLFPNLKVFVCQYKTYAREMYE